MLRGEKFYKFLAISTLGILLLLPITPAQADFGHKHHHRNYRPYHWNRHFDHDWDSYGRISIRLPIGFFSIVIGGEKYYYHAGVYYRHEPYGYVIVPAPIGARVAVLPFDRQIVYMSGVKYYFYNGTYYIPIATGYEVVPPPVATVTPVQAVPTVSTTSQESFTVNIPNNQGGYTAVVLSRKGDGFVGPQGEYYDKFPSVEQLKVMYGQKKK